LCNLRFKFGGPGDRAFCIKGMVHASVGQKLLKRDKIKSFLLDIGFRITNYYKCNTETTQPYVILIMKPHQQIKYSP
jgi:hypothetical protein